MAEDRLRDMIVVLPGITGSVLAEPDGKGGHRDVWALSGGALWRFLTRLGNRRKLLTVPPHDPKGPAPETPLFPTKLMRGFHGVFGLAAVDGYATLVDALTRRLPVDVGFTNDNAPASFVEFPYDWRLSCRHNARLLQKMVERKLRIWRKHTDEPDAKVIVVAHSMGGLVARYWLEVLNGWPDCRILASFGTPYRGSLDTVGYVANGYKKMFVELADVLRSCPSVYELMPFYECVHHNGGWRRPAEVLIPHAVPAYLSAGAAFHQEIRDAVHEHRKDATYLRDGYRVLPYVGVRQTTEQSARLVGTKLTTCDELPEGIDPKFDGGDGRVPRLSGTPLELSKEFRETFLAQQHGSLQNHAGTLDDLVERIGQAQARGFDEIEGTLARREPALDVRVDDLYLPEEPVRVRATPMDWTGPLGFTLTAEPGTTDGAPVPELTVTETGDGLLATAEGLSPGRYRVTVRPSDPVGPWPVTAVFEVAG